MLTFFPKAKPFTSGPTLLPVSEDKEARAKRPSPSDLSGFHLEFLLVPPYIHFASQYIVTDRERQRVYECRVGGGVRVVECERGRST
jgi:hypothetical protein